MLKALKLIRQMVIAVALLVAVFFVFTRRDQIFDRESTSSSFQAINFSAKVEKQPGIRQVVIVVGDAASSTSADVAGYTMIDGVWTLDYGPVGAKVGRNGFHALEVRQESDGSTPIGVFPISGAFGREAAPSGTDIAYTVLAPGDCWISRPDDAAYNRWVVRPSCTAPDVDLYDRSDPDEAFSRAVMLEFNTDGRVANRGSAIFIHQAERDGSTALSTYGGVGLSGRDLARLIGWLDPSLNPVAIIGPRESITAPA